MLDILAVELDRLEVLLVWNFEFEIVGEVGIWGEKAKFGEGGTE